jgi:hypothetical protein
VQARRGAKHKEVQGKPPGEEQRKYQGHLIKLKQEHHQHHHQPLIKASTGPRYTYNLHTIDQIMASIKILA